MDIKVKRVEDSTALKEFISFPNRLYKKNQYYVPPLNRGELKTLSEKNPAFEYCEAAYWLALRNGEIVGRIAGIINTKYNQKEQEKIARFGWLDFAEDEAVLALLFETFEQWAREKGMEKAQGPMGFISFDASGVLVEGFEEVPTSFGHYNYPYYDGMIQANGYEKETDWIEFEVKMPDKVPERITQTAALVRKRYEVRNATFNSRKDLWKYADELFHVINTCYDDLYGFNRLTERQIEQLKKDFFSVINPDYISVVLNSNDELIGFGIAMPSLSRALKKSAGSLFPFGYFRVWRALKKNDTIDLLLLGIIPAYRSKGIHALIFEKIGQSFLDNKIKFLETTRELENNHNVTQLWSKLDSRQHKRARCYVKKLK
ncbi:MAG: hypothetical protein KDC85_08120 [Saprospiraceae bacterium]|nr:hypothetical protein [Saprospiraceae bacterium]MCB9324528.1 hypothetical protein [Lewinellaceae bacterium]